MPKPNPQSGGSSLSSSSGSADAPKKTSGLLGKLPSTSSRSNSTAHKHKPLPALFWLIETSEWNRAAERARRHPKEVKTWASIRSRSSSRNEPGAMDRANSNLSEGSTGSSSSLPRGSASEGGKVTGAKRLALHHACMKLRHIQSRPPQRMKERYGLLNPAPSILSTGSYDSPANGPVIGNDRRTRHQRIASDDSLEMVLGQIDDSGPVDLDEAEEEQEQEDQWVAAIQMILELVRIYPEAAGLRESRHGCLPIHLAAFASCPTESDKNETGETVGSRQGTPVAGNHGSGGGRKSASPQHRSPSPRRHGRLNTVNDGCGEGPPPPPSLASPPSIRRSATAQTAPAMSPGVAALSKKTNNLPRPPLMTKRSLSENSSATDSIGGISHMISEESWTGKQTARKMEEIGEGAEMGNEDVWQRRKNRHRRSTSLEEGQALPLAACASWSPGDAVGVTRKPVPSSSRAMSPLKGKRMPSFRKIASSHSRSPTSSSSRSASRKGSSKRKSSRDKHRTREEHSLLLINALLDAYPKGIRVDSEGGRLPLHTACAGRATPRVVSTLLTAYPAAARHRNKDGFLPLHLAAHWGVSHPDVVVALLRAYPDATLGRNRWERTPLEEALCMAGENGRPHQGSVVRALRKHPSYWTRPPTDLGNLLGSTEGERPGRIGGERSRGGSTPRSASTPRSRGVTSLDSGVGAALAAQAAAAAPAPTSRPVRVRSSGQEERRGRNVVDVDETIADEDSTEEEEEGGGLAGTPLLEGDEEPADNRGGKRSFLTTPRNILRKSSVGNGLVPSSSPRAAASKQHNMHHRRTSSGESGDRRISVAQAASAAALAETTELAVLIKNMSWFAVSARSELHPNEADAIIQVMTRGGYVASFTPLHYACERSPPVESIEALIESCPRAASKPQNPGGYLPLHTACTWNASPGVVGFLLAANPGGARAVDDMANLPLHAACFSGTGIEVVESLLVTYPKAVLSRNCQGSTPADIVRRLRNDNRREVLALLESHRATVMKKRNSSGDQSATAAAALAMNRREDDVVPVSADGGRHTPRIRLGGKKHQCDRSGAQKSESNKRGNTKNKKNQNEDEEIANSLSIECSLEDSVDSDSEMLWI